MFINVPVDREVVENGSLYSYTSANVPAYWHKNHAARNFSTNHSLSVLRECSCGGDLLVPPPPADCDLHVPQIVVLLNCHIRGTVRFERSAQLSPYILFVDCNTDIVGGMHADSNCERRAYWL